MTRLDWEPSEIALEEMFAEWLRHKQKFLKRTLLVKDSKFSKIGLWVDKQRKSHRLKSLPKHRFLKPDAEDFLVFTKAQWNDSYKEIKSTLIKYGKIDIVPTPDNRKLYLEEIDLKNFSF